MVFKEAEQKNKTEERRGTTFNIFRKAIIAVQRDQGDNPLSPSYNKTNSVIQEILRNAEEGRKALQLEEEDIKELKDLAPDFTVLQDPIVTEDDKILDAVSSGEGNGTGTTVKQKERTLWLRDHRRKVL